jgi:DnaK suppressor protein
VKETSKAPVKISKTLYSQRTLKNTCVKNTKFISELNCNEWRKELIKANNDALYYGSYR